MRNISTITIIFFLVAFFPLTILASSQSIELKTAIESGDVKLVKTILKKDNKNLSSSYLQALQSPNKNVKIISTLFKYGLDVNQTLLNGGNGLHQLASPKKQGDEKIKIAKYLIRKKINLEHKDRNGLTPLMKAVIVNDVDLVKILAKSGAQIDLLVPNQVEPKELAGLTTLMVALPSPNMTELLIQLGADLDSKDRTGMSVLEYGEDLLKNRPSLVHKPQETFYEEGIKELKGSGINPDSIVGGSTSTHREILHKLDEKTTEKVESFPADEIRKSLDLIRAAQK